MVLQGCYKSVTKGVTGEGGGRTARRFLQCYMGVTWVLRECYESVTSVLREYNNILRECLES
jgi:hypothetical protein